MTEYDKLMKAFNAHSLKFAYVPSYLLEEFDKNQSSDNSIHSSGDSANGKGIVKATLVGIKVKTNSTIFQK